MPLEGNSYVVFPDHIRKIDLSTNKFNCDDCSDLLAWKVSKLINNNKSIANEITSDHRSVQFQVTSSQIILKKTLENDKIISNPALAQEWMDAVKTTIRVFNPVVESFSFVVDVKPNKFSKNETAKDNFESKVNEVLKRMDQETRNKGNFAELNQIGHLTHRGGHFLHAEFHQFMEHG